MGNGQYDPKIHWINYHQQTRLARTFSQSQSFGIAETYNSSILKLSKKNLTHKMGSRQSDELKIILGRPKSTWVVINDRTTWSFEHSTPNSITLHPWHTFHPTIIPCHTNNTLFFKLAFCSLCFVFSLFFSVFSLPFQPLFLFSLAGQSCCPPLFRQM